MRLLVATHVAAPLEQVWAGFDEKLFIKLAPDRLQFQLLRFDGCQPNDEVHMQIRLPVLGIRQNWISKIIEQESHADVIFFIDVGLRLPFFLKSWRHLHRLERHPEGGCLIIDDIQYKSRIPATDWLLYLPLRKQFKSRGPIYQQIFGAGVL